MRLTSVFISAALLGLSQATLADSNVFLENDGILVIEAESEPATGQWSLQTEIPGFSGNGYYLWQGPNRFGGPSDNADDHIEYRFRIQTAGNYQLRWRSRIGTGTQATEHNDSWISFPTGVNIDGEEPINGWTKVYMSQLDTWSWDAYTVDGKAALIRQYFDAGEHRIRVSGRSNGHAIDKISLFAYESVNFSDARFNALPQSRSSDAPGASHTQQPDTCYAGELALQADRFASDKGSSHSLSDELAVASNSRYGYLTFDLSRVPPTVSEASLALILSSPARGTTASVYAGSHSAWDKRSNVSRMPYPETLLGQSSISGELNAVQYIRLDESLLTRGLQTLILTADASADELTFATIDRSAAPQLRLSGDSALCEFFANGGSPEADSGSSSAPETNAESGITEENIDATATAEENIAESGIVEETSGETATVEETLVQTESGNDAIAPDDTESLIPIPTIDPDNESINGNASSKSGLFGGPISFWALLMVVTYRIARQRVH